MTTLTERASAFKIVNTLNAQTLTSSDVNGSTVDTKGFNSCFIAVNIGANGGTLNGSNNVTFVLQDSDDDSTWADVTSSALAGGYTVDSSGVFATIDDGAEDEASAKVAYTGNKRYVRVQADVTGTISLPVSAQALLGDGLKPQA
jgi:hypothetical protein|tara:strand:+ start:117 stop:551 length:435 start_codon:yes stop_codon:yes gene_type:complete